VRAAPDHAAPAVNRAAAITISIMLATIMQAIDTTIANVALPHIQGSLSAGVIMFATLALMPTMLQQSMNYPVATAGRHSSANP
jgi:hypothetical protein